MKLIDEIIEILSADEPNLINALLKTKILLYKIGQNNLIEWVNNEINGYSEESEVPPYRKLGTEVLANFSNMTYRYTRHPIPLSHLDKDYRESLKTAKLRQSLGVLEEFVSSDVGHIQSAIPLEANHLLGKGLDSSYQVQRAWCEISTSEITQILIEVRSRLLDFILELSGKFGENLSDKEVKIIGQALDTPSMFSNAIFGDNTTILVGNNNQQTVSINVLNNDFSSLSELLRSQHVSEPDIQELESALETDELSTEITNKKFGPAVKIWFKTMLSKAVDASWQIEIGIASSFLADALKKYYGW